MNNPKANAVEMVHRIRDKQAKQFAAMSDKQLLAHLNDAGERSLAEARAARPAAAPARGTTQRSASSPGGPMFRALLATFVLACLGACASHASVEFRAASTTSTPGSVRMIAPISAATIYVAPQVVVSNSDIASASVGATEDGRRAVNITLTDGGASKLLAYTSAHLNEPIAIMVDGQLVSAPVVFSPLSRTAMIIGGANGLTQVEAERIVESLNRRHSNAKSAPADASLGVCAAASVRVSLCAEAFAFRCTGVGHSSA